MKAQGTVLIIDDEPYVRESLAAMLGRRGYAVRTSGAADGLLSGGSLDGVDVVLTDLRMPGLDGLQLLRKVAEREPGLPVIVLTGHGSVPSAVECIKAGAFDYLLKPANPEQLLLLIERATQNSRMSRELEYLRSGGGRGAPGAAPIGASPKWLQAMEWIEAAAPSDTPVLLLGESGTGKEVAAQYLHRRSSRARGPFVRVNCAAVPFDLFESEFFGHRRGAFTGALADREGRFRVAHGGTIFMDEIASMPEAAQAKVLRVLQDGTFERVGESFPTSVDVRLIAASNIDLEAEVQAGRFRRDLFHRINVMTIPIPPLRERREDIPVLAGAFLQEFNGRLAKSVTAIHPDTLAILHAYPWPGNIRELRNVIERAVLLEKSAVLLPASLPFSLRRDSGEGGRNLNLRSALAAEERRTLEEALRLAGGVRRSAARLLGIDERNLGYFLRKHGMTAGRGKH
jgi:two-component system response regulator AtoC